MKSRFPEVCDRQFANIDANGERRLRKTGTLGAGARDVGTRDCGTTGLRDVGAEKQGPGTRDVGT